MLLEQNFIFKLVHTFHSMNEMSHGQMANIYYDDMQQFNFEKHGIFPPFCLNEISILFWHIYYAILHKEGRHDGADHVK